VGVQLHTLNVVTPVSSPLPRSRLHPDLRSRLRRSGPRAQSQDVLQRFERLRGAGASAAYPTALPGTASCSCRVLQDSHAGSVAAEPAVAGSRRRVSRREADQPAVACGPLRCQAGDVGAENGAVHPAVHSAVQVRLHARVSCPLEELEEVGDRFARLRRA